jgi:hypothetical protein
MVDISEEMYISPSYGLSSRGFTMDAEILAITLGTSVVFNAAKMPENGVPYYSPRLP